MRVRFRWLGSAGVLLGFAALGLHAFEAHADGMYCGSRLISTGDTLYRVRSVCGEPDDAQQRVETRVEHRRIRVPCVANGPRRGAQCEQVIDVAVNVIVDEWTYDQGSQRLIKYLTFFDGRLGRLQTGGYGSDER